jgi:hypothetical protein
MIGTACRQVYEHNENVRDCVPHAESPLLNRKRMK